MKMIGRKREKKELMRLSRTGKSELVCVYGRRRVGKTWLVEQTFSNCFAFRATGVEEGNTRQQLKAFHRRLQESGSSEKTIPPDWFEAFHRLERLLACDEVMKAAHGKKVVFLDEFPWFATPRSDFLMAFGEFWNRYGASAGDVLFIICGSATSWIIGNVLSNTGSLYDRVTAQIFLEPFTLKETEAFFRENEFDWSRRQIAECQMVFGGLPFFFDLLNRDESLTRNIDRLLFDGHALLRDESRRLLEATLRKNPVYGKILSRLANHPHGLRKSLCMEQEGIAKGTFTRAVDDLVKCGYVHEYKNLHEERKPLYLQLTDPFLLFHFRFLSKGGKKESVETFGELTQDAGRYHDWRGFAFEILCISHVKELKEALGIAGVKTSHYPWKSKKKKGGAQIDLVIERDDGIVNLLEMKYTDRPFAIDMAYEEGLLHKRDVYREETKTKKALKIIMVAAAGISGTAHTEHISGVLTLDDLFE